MEIWFPIIGIVYKGKEKSDKQIIVFDVKENKILGMTPYMKSITEVLMLNASFMDNIGFLNGKMGVSIFFFNLSRWTNNGLYEAYANGLIEEIQEEINHTTPVGFSNGLSGIGFGIEHLIQKGFINADPDEVLEEIDHAMFIQLVFNTPGNIGLSNGLIGMGTYLLKRIKNPISNDGNISTLKNKQTLIHLIDELDRKTQNIGDIIKESQFVPKERQTGTNVSNMQDIKSAKFDILWDYPILIWFLVDLHDQNIFNFKLEKLMERVMAPLLDEENWPTRECNRLLLALSIKQFEQYICLSGNYGSDKNKVRFDVHKDINPKILGNICSKLLSGIDRKDLRSGLIYDNATIRHGYFGIAWLYTKLHAFTKDVHHWKESRYWHQKGVDLWQKMDGRPGMDTKNHDGPLGLLEGLSGIGAGVFNFFRPDKA